jgi:hypothetical protein
MKPDTVTASEIADFAYCPEAWRFSALGHQSANRAVQVAGTDHYTGLATSERVAGGSIAIGRFLIVIALLALVSWVLWR